MIGVVTSSKTIASHKTSWKTIGFKFLTARSHLKTGQISFVFHAVSEESPERCQCGSTLHLGAMSTQNFVWTIQQTASWLTFISISPILLTVFWMDFWFYGPWKLWRPCIRYWPDANKYSACRLLFVCM